MKGFGPESFGEWNAHVYGEQLGTRMDDETRDTVDVLADLAGGGSALELAIGTGRVALPLAARGVTVHGIDASDKMVAKLRGKPGGDAIPVTIGDMSETRVDGKFDLVFLVFNTIFNLTSQEAQVRCFQNAADHMKPGGVFVIETCLPEISGFVDGQDVRGRGVGTDNARFEIRIHDPVAQTIDYQRVVLTSEGAELCPLAMRYAWPSELDLMARLAGLELRERWAWWDRSRFTEDSTAHVSVYQWAASP
jgi:SAM-dependent methyltransferase